MKSKIFFAILPPEGQKTGDTIAIVQGTLEIQPGEPLPKSWRQKSIPPKPGKLTPQDIFNAVARAMPNFF